MFNGNIAQVIWQSASDHVKRDYKYGYDSFNRLKKASFSDSDYNLNQVTYDKGGNITALHRNLQNGFHNFQYQYDGNQVHSINGTQTINGEMNPVMRSYSYDANGNMITDSSKGVSLIEYNYLSLPERVVLSNGQSIEYDYTANGVKLQKRYLANGQTMTTDYINGFQYENGELLFFGQPEGYVVHTVATNGVETNQYVHNFTDHLGNVRISYTDLDGSGSIDLGGEIVKERNYYPFGLQHQGYNNVEFPLGSMFKYGFGGKELQEENSIGWMDFGSRNYDAELGRWFNTDPQNQFASPYLYAFNNPIIAVDPDGEFAHIIIGAVIGGVVNLAVKAAQGKIDSWGDGFAAFGIGAAAGAIGAATGGAAFLAAGGGAAGAGGFLAGAAGGAVGTAFASPVQNLGNHLYFGDPIMTPQQYLSGIAIGGVTGGVINGSIASLNGRNFWDGAINLRSQLTPLGQNLKPEGINENSSRSIQSARNEIKQAIPDNGGPINYKAEYYNKVSGPDGVHNWNRTTIEIVADNGKVFPGFNPKDPSQTLIQHYGNRFGDDGVFEIIIKDGIIQHQGFSPGGIINGVYQGVGPVSPPPNWFLTRNSWPFN